MGKINVHILSNDTYIGIYDINDSRFVFYFAVNNLSVIGFSNILGSHLDMVSSYS